MSEEAPPTPEQQQERFNEMFGTAMSKFIEDNKPDPEKTQKPKGFLDSLFGL